MRTEEIEVIIDSEGEVQITVRGVKGKGCVDLTRSLEEELGGAVGKRVFTSEYYESERAAQTITDKPSRLKRE